MFRRVIAIIVAILATGILGIFATIGCLLFRNGNITNIIGIAWSHIILRTAGIRVRTSGMDPSRDRTPCIFIANHQSMVDIWALLPALPICTRFVAKESLFRIPVFGWAIRSAGFIPIDRSRLGKAMQSLERAAATIRKGESVLLFPEGTRSRNGRLRPFKKGAFHLALKARVPIVPVSIQGSFERLPPNTLLVIPGEVRVRFCDPIPVEEYADLPVDELKDRLETIISEALEQQERAAAS